MLSCDQTLSAWAQERFSYSELFTLKERVSPVDLPLGVANIFENLGAFPGFAGEMNPVIQNGYVWGCAGP